MNFLNGLSNFSDDTGDTSDLMNYHEERVTSQKKSEERGIEKTEFENEMKKEYNKEKYTVYEDCSDVSNFENYGLIPVVCVHRIFLFLPVESLCNVYSACRLFNKVGNTNFFWKEKLESTYRCASGNEKKSKGNYKKHFVDQHFLSHFRLREEYFKTTLGDLKNATSTDRGDDNEYDDLLKIVLCGPSPSGKSCYLMRITRDDFMMENKSTIGVEFASRLVHYNNLLFKLQIWDTAGKERYRAITSAYYRGSSACMLCVNLTDRTTFEERTKWIKEIRHHCVKDVIVMVCGMFSDLKNDRVITHSEIRSFLRENNIKNTEYCEVSSLEKEGMYYPLGRILEIYYERNLKSHGSINL